MISWVFFDLGGTLLDDSLLVDRIGRAYVELLRARGVPVTPDQFVTMRDLLIARGARPLFRTVALEFARDPKVADEMRDEVWRRTADSEVDGQRAFPESAGVLEAVSRHASVGVIANQRRSVRGVLRREGLERFFRVVLISEEAGVSKPDPALFERALREAGCSPHEAAMVGDRPDFDIAPAKALGFHTVRTRTGLFRNQVAGGPGEVPDVEVPSLQEVPAALDRIARRV